MEAAQSSLIRLCSELSYGDEIEAWCFGKLLHRGRVNRTLPSAEMFWITCSRTGTRKLVDMDDAAILRIPAAPLDARSAGPPSSSTWREPSRSGPQYVPASATEHRRGHPKRTMGRYRKEMTICGIQPRRKGQETTSNVNPQGASRGSVGSWAAREPCCSVNHSPHHHSSPYFAHSSHRDLRLNVGVRLDAVEGTAKVNVRGVVTHTNLRALYVVCRRVVTKFPGYEVVVNLAHAGVTAAAFDELREHARQSSLSSGLDSLRLRIVEPPVTLKVHQHAYALPSA